MRKDVQQVECCFLRLAGVSLLLVSGRIIWLDTSKYICCKTNDMSVPSVAKRLIDSII
jgi:hypothetical protein